MVGRYTPDYHQMVSRTGRYSRDLYVFFCEGTNATYEKPHKYSENSCYYGYFQIGPDYPTSNVVFAELFSHLVNEKCFNTLRTNVSLYDIWIIASPIVNIQGKFIFQEQLGYIVRCDCRRDNGVIAFIVYLQTEQHPAHVRSRVDTFLESLLVSIGRRVHKEAGSRRAWCPFKIYIDILYIIVLLGFSYWNVGWRI